MHAFGLSKVKNLFNGDSHKFWYSFAFNLFLIKNKNLHSSLIGITLF